MRDRDAVGGFEYDEEDFEGCEERYVCVCVCVCASDVLSCGCARAIERCVTRRAKGIRGGCASASTDPSFVFCVRAMTAAKAKQVRRGVKEVVKALKKETKGVCVIAGDISPIDVITHVPILCEEANVPYVYVHSKEELGAAGMTKRPTSVMLVLPEGTKGSVKMSSDDKKEFDDMYSKIVSKVKSMSK